MLPKQVLTALYKVLAEKDVQTSGNIDNQLRQMEPEQVMELSDGHVSKTGIDSWEAFELGLALGRDVREKTVYRADIDRDHYFFIGNEADIIRKIEESGVSGEGEISEDNQETIDLLEKEIREV